MLTAGFGRAEITTTEPGLSLLGWGEPGNVAKEVVTPLFARAMVVSDPASGTKLAYVCADLAFITTLLRRGVIDRLRNEHAALGLDEHNVMLTATHTHSGPSGFSHYLFYALASPGISLTVYETLVDGITAAIVEADRKQVAARLWSHAGEIPLTSPIAFNRSMFAYNSNVDVEPLPWERRDEAVDRTMRLLRADSVDGTPLGLISWFGVHGTAVHRDHKHMHGDHKGLAALDVEQRVRAQSPSAQSFVALFPQTTAADVTPNFRHDQRRGFTVGRFNDDFRNAEEHANEQSRHAREIYERAPFDGQELRDSVTAMLRYESIAQRPVEADLTNGAGDRVTSRPQIGLGALAATAEGPLPLWPLRGLLRARQNAVHALKPLQRFLPDRLKSDDSKIVIADPNGAFGMSYQTLILRHVPGPFGAAFQRLVDQPAPGVEMVPVILPVQLFSIGSFCIAALPCEVSTVSGRRLRATIGQAFADAGRPNVSVVVNGYANAYSSYLTTPEEYRHQHYEAASTLFGPWTLPAYQSMFRALARTLVTAPSSDVGARPYVPTVAQLRPLRYRPVAA